MASSDSQAARPPDERFPYSLLFVGVLVTAVGGALVALLYFGPGDNASLPPLRADILKSIAGAILQLTILGVAGVAVKALFDRHQERRKEAREDAERERVEKEAAAEKRRQVRNALTELRKALLRRLLSANRTVRKARILLPAHASAKTYGEQMRTLIDIQLELSDIRHEIETTPALFPSGNEVGRHLDMMEAYLKKLVDEYQSRYQEIVSAELTKDRSAVRAALNKLDGYRDFVVGEVKGSGLDTEYLQPYWAAKEAMRRDILNELSDADGAGC